MLWDLLGTVSSAVVLVLCGMVLERARSLREVVLREERRHSAEKEQHDAGESR